MTDHQDYTYPGELLKDRIILITGASDGIGRALAVHAAGHGAQVILHGRNVSKLEKVYDQIEALRGAPRPSIAVMDLAVAGSDAYTSLADSLSAEFGRLDGLVNNASILEAVLGRICSF
jgi:NAD(P)-dependent dehydrogenase (short-subunit alcohol dehydrogenase family)